MIAALKGRVLHRDLNRIIVDVNGVGYEVFVAASALESSPVGAEVFLHVHTAFRENSLELFGFPGRLEKSFFEMLLTVGGIGPRLAMTILSGISPGAFRDAVVTKDVPRLTSIPGIGKKSAERICLELKDKVDKIGPVSQVGEHSSGAHALEADLVSSLLNLGYKDREARLAARTALGSPGGDGGSQSLQDALRSALKALASSR
jgi:holliday junction DNA helicase RuvA